MRYSYKINRKVTAVSGTQTLQYFLGGVLFAAFSL